MVEKWFEIIFDHRIGLRERMFRVVTAACMIALVFVLLMGRTFSNLLILAISLFITATITKVSIQKRCINTGATAISLLLLLIFPIGFFTAGGFFSGVPEWGVLCFIYISITLVGRRKIVFFLLTVAEILFCYYFAFYFPDFVVKNSLRRSFFDSVFSVILVGMLSSVLLLFLNLLYNKEYEITQRQKKEIERKE